MPRYDVKVVYTCEYTYTIDAEAPGDAQEIAMGMLGAATTKPERTSLQATVARQGELK